MKMGINLLFIFFAAVAVAQQDNGSSCLYPEDCLSGYCDSLGICGDAPQCTSSSDCDTGYECMASGLCADVDECASDPCDANASCTNTAGGHSCACNSGYSGDGFNCADDDECFPNSPCDTNANCLNTDGSFTCECYSGYYGDGFSCTEGCLSNDDCDPYADYCSSGTCVSKANDGESCTDDFQCFSYYCGDLGSCEAQVDNSSPCQRDNQCYSFYCDPATSTCDFAPVGSYCSTGGYCASSYCDYENNVCSLYPNDFGCGDHSECTSDYCDPTTTLCADDPCVEPTCAACADVSSSCSWCVDSSGAEQCVNVEKHDMQACTEQYTTSASCPVSGCSSDADCDTSEYCDSTSTCAAKLSDGNECTSNAMCASAFCDDSGTSAVCAADPCTATDCGACADASYACAWCKDDLGSEFCYNEVITPDQQCAEVATTSSVCPAPSCTLDSDCVSGEYCDNGSCALQADEGAGCGSNSECSTGYCSTAGVCERYPTGFECNSHDQCASGYCAYDEGTQSSVCTDDPCTHSECQACLADDSYVCFWCTS
eukprot:Rmarinus@m.18970